MDLSKLPRLSNTPQAPAAAPTDIAGDVSPSAAPGGGAAKPQNLDATAPAGLSSPRAASIGCPSCGVPLRAGAAFCDRCGAVIPRPGVGMTFGLGAEAWISIALGVILLLFFNQPISYWRSRGHPEDFEATHHFWDEAGNIITYPQSAFFLPEVAFVAFAAMLVLEGLILLVAARVPSLLLAMLVVITGVVAFNVIALAKAFPKIGFQILPALAVAIGVYMAIFQLGLYKSLQSASRSKPGGAA